MPHIQKKGVSEGSEGRASSLLCPTIHPSNQNRMVSTMDMVAVATPSFINILTLGCDRVTDHEEEEEVEGGGAGRREERRIRMMMIMVMACQTS